MAEKRNITREDILIKARIASEGVRLPMGGQIVNWGPAIVLDGCELVMYTWHNPRSRLQMSIDGGADEGVDRNGGFQDPGIAGKDIAIVDEGEVLATGQVQERLPWWDTLLSNGSTAESAAMVAGHTDTNIVFTYSCHNQDTGKACRYCSKFSPESLEGLADVIATPLGEAAMRQAEGLKVATDNGWRGTVFVSAGALPPELPRDEVLARLETTLAPIRDMLGPRVLSEVNMLFNNYPPDDFKEMETWRDMGISATSFDIEVMDPAYWAAVCPGKAASGTHEHWKEAQIASTEIFGPGRGTMSSVVLGMEPMETLLAGVEEGCSHGVFPIPVVFLPAIAGKALESFRPPTAEWYVDVAEQVVDRILQHADKLGMDPMADTRAGMTRTGLSYPVTLITDEITRRAQERGVFPPGLPRQDCPDPAYAQ